MLTLNAVTPFIIDCFSWQLGATEHCTLSYALKKKAQFLSSVSVLIRKQSTCPGRETITLPEKSADVTFINILYCWHQNQKGVNRDMSETVGCSTPPHTHTHTH